MIDKDTYLRFSDEALDHMRDVVVELGDELGNRRPDLAGANSPVQILTHCLGVMAYWAREVNLGVDVHRDRPAEFEAVCRVAELADDVAQARARFHDDVAAAQFDAAPARGRSSDFERSLCTQGAVLMHVYEELAQHRGQLELTRDVLQAGTWTPGRRSA
jgi:uncharacterized damage-inducible protein DinB